MKDVEVRLIAELMKNSRRSDRELAKAVRVSQPTISRMIRKLEKEGYIKDYTMCPDFSKLGFNIMSITFTKLRKPYSDEDIEEKRKEMAKEIVENPIAEIMHLRGIGLGSERVIVTLHNDYGSHSEFIDRLKSNPLIDVADVKSFLIDLTDKKGNFRNLSLDLVSNFLLRMKK